MATLSPALIQRYRYLNTCSETVLGKGIIGQPDLMDAVMASKILLAREAKDKVYAFLGIFQVDRSILSPDYSLSVEQIYQQFSQHLLLIGLGNRLIAAAGASRQNLERLPSSWLDLTYTGQAQASYLETAKGYNWQLHAGGGAEFAFSLRPESMQITLKGTYFDRVRTVGPCFVLSEFLFQSRLSFWLPSTQIFLGQHVGPRYPTTNVQLDAFSHLITAEDPRFSQNPTESYRTWIRHELEFLQDAKPPGDERRNVATDYLFPPEVLQYRQCFQAVVDNRAVCITQNGYLGLVRTGARIGDEVWVVSGCDVPLITRPDAADPTTRELLCDAYVLDVMNGEALNVKGAEIQDVVLR